MEMKEPPKNHFCSIHEHESFSSIWEIPQCCKVCGVMFSNEDEMLRSAGRGIGFPQRDGQYVIWMMLWT